MSEKPSREKDDYLAVKAERDALLAENAKLRAEQAIAEEKALAKAKQSVDASLAALEETNRFLAKKISAIIRIVSGDLD